MIIFKKTEQDAAVQKNSDAVDVIIKNLPMYLNPSSDNEYAKTMYKLIDRLMLVYCDALLSTTSDSVPSLVMPLTLKEIADLKADTMTEIVQEAAKPLVKLAEAIIKYIYANYKYDRAKASFPDARFGLGVKEPSINHSANHVLRKWQKAGIVDYAAVKGELKNTPENIAVIEVVEKVVFK